MTMYHEDRINSRLWAIFLVICVLAGLVMDLAQTMRDIDDTLARMDTSLNSMAQSYQALLKQEPKQDLGSRNRFSPDFSEEVQ